MSLDNPHGRILEDCFGGLETLSSYDECAFARGQMVPIGFAFGFSSFKE
jgi:hypothetical protein